MLYDEVKKLISKSKFPVNFKEEILQKTRLSKLEIDKMAEESVNSLHNGIDDAIVILIEDNKRIFEEIENIKIDQFREIKFPFNNFFIEFNMENLEGNSNHKMTVGLHVFSDISIGLRSDNIYNIAMYSMKNNNIDSLISLMALLKLDKLPRFYFCCQNKCENMINPTNLGDMLNKEVCQRTERTAKDCPMTDFLLYGIKIIIYVINLINSKPKVVQENNVIQNNKAEQVEQNTNKPKSSNNRQTTSKYIYIQVDKPKKKRNVKLSRKVTVTRKSPAPHIRRGHYRHLKSGKVVWVEISQVGLKEKAKKKIYKVK